MYLKPAFIQSALLFFCIAQFPLSAQISEKDFPPVVITGEIEQPEGPDGEVAIRAMTYFQDILTGSQQKEYGLLDTQNQFKLSFQVPFEMGITLGIGHTGFPAIVSPGDHIQVREVVDSNGNYDIEITGDHQEINRWLYTYDKYLKANDVFDQYYEPLKKMTRGPDTDLYVSYFLTIQEELTDMRYAYLDSFLLEYPDAPPRLKEWATYEIEYAAAHSWLNAPWKGQSRVSGTEENPIYANEEFMDFGRQFARNKPQARISPQYLGFFTQGFILQLTHPRDPDLPVFPQRIGFVLDYFDGFCQEVLLTNLFINQLSFQKGLAGIEEFIPIFDEHVSDLYLRTGFYDAYDKATDPEQAHVITSDAIELMDFPDSMKTVLPAILEKHRGKVVLIDFWGTWCAPCLDELPHYAPLMEKFDPSEVVFVFFAAGSPLNRWKQLIDYYKVPGVHLRLNQGQLLVLDELFDIRGYPTHVLIDREGAIVDANAPGPNHGQGDYSLEQRIRKLLER